MLLSVIKEVKADLWVFDNDGTLYTKTREIKLAIESLMIGFISVKYNVDKIKAEKIREKLLKLYNTKFTLAALKKEGIDEERFIQETYLAVIPEQYGIVENKKLREMISSLIGEKIIITDNPSEFAKLILKSLGVLDLFSKVYGMKELQFTPKSQNGISKILKKEPKKKSTIYIDDELESISAAKRIGCITVLVGNKYPNSTIPDYWIPSLI